jgi:hypothetical protein
LRTSLWRNRSATTSGVQLTRSESNGPAVGTGTTVAVALSTATGEPEGD